MHAVWDAACLCAHTPHPCAPHPAHTQYTGNTRRGRHRWPPQRITAGVHLYAGHTGEETSRPNVWVGTMERGADHDSYTTMDGSGRLVRHHAVADGVHARQPDAGRQPGNAGTDGRTGAAGVANGELPRCRRACHQHRIRPPDHPGHTRHGRQGHGCGAHVGHGRPSAGHVHRVRHPYERYMGFGQTGGWAVDDPG